MRALAGLAQAALVAAAIAHHTPGLAGSSDPVVLERWGDTTLGGPVAVAVDRASGTVYAIDSGVNAVRRFDASGGLTGTWGRGPGTVQLVKPEALAVDRHGHVYVGDTGTHRVLKVTPDGRLLATFGSEGRGAGQFNVPRGLAVDDADHLYVAELGNNRVQKLDTAGRTLATWTGSSTTPLAVSGGAALGAGGRVYVVGGTRVWRLAPGGQIEGTWEFSRYDGGEHTGVVRSTPSGIATDAAGNAYVSDTQNHRVLKLSPDGRLQRAWGWKGTARGAFHFSALAGVTVGGSGDVYVADFFNHRVQRFSGDGALRSELGGFAGDGQLRQPQGLGLDRHGFVYVADTRNHRVVKFTGTGAVVARWGAFGRGDGEFQHPEGVAVGGDGHVYVADRANDRIQKLGADGTYLTQWGRRPWRPDDVGHVLSPRDVALGPLGDVYVLSRSKILRFSRSGAPLGEWSFTGSGVRLATDAAGNVYVSSTAQAVRPPPPDIYKVYKFDRFGALIAAWGTDGLGEGRLNFPAAVAVDAQGHIHVGDSVRLVTPGGPRVQKFDQGWRFLQAWSLPSVTGGGFSATAIALDGAGHAFVLHGNAVLKIRLPAPP